MSEPVKTETAAAASDALVGGPAGAGGARDAKFKGLILAAGQGLRLGNAAEGVPKCLLEIGRRCLAEHQLAALADADIGPTAIVVGYGADEVRDKLGIRAEYITNTRWDRTNSLYSLWMARAWLTGPVVILNSDVLFSPEVLERLLDTEGDAVVIDSSSGRGREQMKVEVVQGRLKDMRKDLPADRICGENVGILKLTRDTVQELLEEATRLIESGHEKSWLGSAVRLLATRKPISVVDVAGLPWVEIDFPTDLVRARKEVWPRIRRSSPERRLRKRLALGAGVLALSAVPFVVSGLLPRPPERVWEAIPLDTTRHEHVPLGDTQESWWLFDAERSVEASVRGPEPVRIDTRLLDPEPGRSDYVLEVNVDGRRVGWFAAAPRPSDSRKHPAWVIGDRERVELELEAGLHELEVRLVAPVAARCLIRVRRLQETSED